MPVGLHSRRVWRNSIFSLFPSLVDIHAAALNKTRAEECDDYHNVIVYEKLCF